MAEITPQNMAEKLLAAGFQRTEPSATALSDPIADTPMVVTLDQLRPYDHGPRKKRKPAYEEIKASNGFHSDTTSPTRMTSCDARPCRMGLIRRVPCNTTAASSCNTGKPRQLKPDAGISQCQSPVQATGNVFAGFDPVVQLASQAFYRNRPSRCADAENVEQGVRRKSGITGVESRRLHGRKALSTKWFAPVYMAKRSLGD